MKRSALTRRLDQLAGASQWSEVTIELGICDTQEAYERAFAKAWAQVSPGAVVCSWLRPLSSAEFIDMAAGRQLQPHGVMGIYLKHSEAYS